MKNIQNRASVQNWRRFFQIICLFFQNCPVKHFCERDPARQAPFTSWQPLAADSMPRFSGNRRRSMLHLSIKRFSGMPGREACRTAKTTLTKEIGHDQTMHHLDGRHRVPCNGSDRHVAGGDSLRPSHRRPAFCRGAQSTGPARLVHRCGFEQRQRRRAFLSEHPRIQKGSGARLCAAYRRLCRGERRLFQHPRRCFLFRRGLSRPGRGAECQRAEPRRQNLSGHAQLVFIESEPHPRRGLDLPFWRPARGYLPFRRTDSQCAGHSRAGAPGIPGHAFYRYSHRHRRRADAA